MAAPAGVGHRRDLLRRPLRALGAGQLARHGDRLHAGRASTGASGCTERAAAPALWNYALFFHGEDAVADNLSPYIDAAPLEEQKYFLATQQVDEARHAVFFKRFMHEVVGVGDGTMAGGAARDRPRAHLGLPQGLRAASTGWPTSCAATARKPKLAAAVTLYHIVVEATLAQPGQHFIEAYLEERDLLPGFREGMRNVALDEQRHIGFGVKLLADLYREDPGPIQDAIVGLIKEVLPWTVGGGQAAELGPLLHGVLRLHARGHRRGGRDARSSRACAPIGLPIDTIPGFPMPMDLPPRERAVRGQKLLRAGLIGPGDDGVAQDPEAIEIMFDTIRRRRHHRRRPRPARRSSGTSPTPSPGTSCWTTAPRARCRAARRMPT